MLSVDALAEFTGQSGHALNDILEWVRSFKSDGPLPDDFSLLEVFF